MSVAALPEFRGIEVPEVFLAQASTEGALLPRCQRQLSSEASNRDYELTEHCHVLVGRRYVPCSALFSCHLYADWLPTYCIGRTF
jgi:hypothetical protein